jgi:Fic family protein
VPVSLNIIPTTLLTQYLSSVDDIAVQFNALHESEISTSTFSFYTSVSAVFSSKIEGEDIELDSFVKHRTNPGAYMPDYTQKIDDLYDAYLYAKDAQLNEENILQAHALLTRHILQEPYRGTIRKGNMFVITKDGKIEYVAPNPANVTTEIAKLYQDIQTLLSVNLSAEEVFFYASFIHLLFVKIHPFEDGNGRTARLLEKWFIAQKLGPKAWFINSEKHYYDNHSAYYNNIRALGLEYELLDYGKALPFLLMLAKSL